jgi:hypothetical protein
MMGTPEIQRQGVAQSTPLHPGASRMLAVILL